MIKLEIDLKLCNVNNISLRELGASLQSNTSLKYIDFDFSHCNQAQDISYANLFKSMAEMRQLETFIIRF